MNRRSFLVIATSAAATLLISKEEKKPKTWAEFSKLYKAKTGKPVVFVNAGPGGSNWLTNVS